MTNRWRACSLTCNVGCQEGAMEEVDGQRRKLRKIIAVTENNGLTMLQLHIII